MKGYSQDKTENEEIRESVPKRGIPFPDAFDVDIIRILEKKRIARR
jgi:hypothetical protein